MLKALELCGFKSFADRTRFEFPPGITVVVGPNGSGKSNIVDAIKWVLGEQSAKSLRGREMADVIFKGSGATASARRPSNTAEVTIVFDNADRLLPVDSAEIRVTRRVFRSGEGEYAINENPCRLRDVRDLFRGTGMGTDAYSLIEQGKVDTLLQTSPRDRRAIFEEAAGISRFKAKKVETQRRLERVEQNLERLSDIVDEVETQLRTVRNQASKARRYKEYNDRLKELRTHVGLADWRRLTAQLDALERQYLAVTQQADDLQSATRDAEAASEEVDHRGRQLEQRLHEAEATAAQLRQDLARSQSTTQHEYQRLDELAHEIQRFRRQWRAMTTRAGGLGVELQQLQQHVASARADDESIRQRLLEQQVQLDTTERELVQQRRRRDEQQQEQASQLRTASDLSRKIAILDSEVQSAEEQIDRSERQRAVLDEQHEQLRRQVEQLETAERALHEQEQDARAQLQASREELQSDEHELNHEQQRAVDLQRRFTVATERANVLRDLERRHEGLSPGVKELLLQAQNTPLGCLGSVRGMVADLIRVDVRMAPMIDAALGELTQYVIVEGSGLAEQLANGDLSLSGRVGIIDLKAPPMTAAADPLRLTTDRTVLGRADRFVEADARYSAVIQLLLGTTWCVETLRDALRLRSLVTPPVRFVTRAGEVLEADGRLLAGPRQAALGLVSRRSELRSLQREIVELEPQLQTAEAHIAQLRNRIAAATEQVDQLVRHYDEAAAALMNARLATRAAADRLAALDPQREELAAQLAQQHTRRRESVAQRQEFSLQLDETEGQLRELERQALDHQRRLVELERQREQEVSRITETKVERAKSEQRLDSLLGQLVRCEEDQRERERALEETRSQLRSAELRLVQSERTILQHSAIQADLSLHAERQESRIRELIVERDQLALERHAAQSGLADCRRELQRVDERRHALDLDIHRLQMERDALVERVREDYDIELAQLGNSPATSEDEQRQREEIDREITDLRRRLSNIGAVNMAALEEIEGLEQRHLALSEQYRDLVDAKEAMVRIIHKINVDSRRLFSESLESIRANFQTLFRRVFGGGNADIVLEDGMDILEAGVDIIATPPGKHSLGISLLSGGERALTAVTLLLAIFQYRPSPFCVLDEVDGPLDESNIGRFLDVLNDFLRWTKFVVVTHSKKTMTAAHTLYGVTMQESGVSKRVSVQFEDVSEDGHIRQEAIDRSSTPPPAETAGDGGDERGAA